MSLKKRFLKTNKKMINCMKSALVKVDGRVKKHYSEGQIVETLLEIFFNRNESFLSVEKKMKW